MGTERIDGVHVVGEGVDAVGEDLSACHGVGVVALSDCPHLPVQPVAALVGVGIPFGEPLDGLGVGGGGIRPKSVG